MRFFFLSIIFVTLSWSKFSAQEKNELLFRIVNSESSQPVAYATIKFTKSNNGTIANILGDFRIPIHYKKDSETLNISCIGYYSKKVDLSLLTSKPYHIIYLFPKTEALSEVVLSVEKTKELSTRQIVKKAIENIKINYPVDPFSYIAYYRDYQFADEEYINLNEGIVEVFDQGFTSHKISDSLNATSLYSYKLNTDFKQDSLISNSIYNGAKQIKDGKMGSGIGNELTLLNIHNPIRNFNTGSFSFVYIFEKDFIKNHSFKNKGIVYLDDEELYKIAFVAKKEITGFAYNATGYIYIARSDFAIHQFEYNLYSNSPRKLIFTLDVEYNQRENGKMYLNYITFNNNFFITENDALQVENYYYNKENSSLYIEFNRPIDLKSIEKLNNIKISFNDKKLTILKINAINGKTIELKFKREDSDFLNQQNVSNLALFSLKFKNYKDEIGFGMGKSKVEGYQFRELFVQRVFLNSEYNSKLKYIKKGESLRNAPLNNADITDYWLNSPLMKTE
tara:strand:+ start:937 stop:2460 length:1524 start_codon:yes stop_codon:yes gene_type:complete